MGKLRASLPEDLVQQIINVPIGVARSASDVQIWSPAVDRNFTRSRRKLTTDPSCAFCGWHVESVLHILRDCERAKGIWQSLTEESNYDPIKIILIAARESVHASFAYEDTLSSRIGAGGVIQNSVGDWVSGFSVNIAKGQILEIEVWGLYFGLRLAIDKGIQDIVVEMDAATTVLLI
ncbi:PREDICTED: reverse mRNAase [Prunus dulcis]|uniref:PREDICTED: reverse mRNAase n=1 Tax=Prunus dulcis TaxID=3755 RepID=A0A5E4G9B3_PRUDU|nr:PREDICTED: reverse mRNAase [Prunus dulcis]